MLRPFTQLIKRVLIVNGIYEDSYICIFEEKMCQIMCSRITRSIPDHHSELMFLSLRILGLHHFVEVLHNLSGLLGFTPLRVIFHEGVDYGCFAHIGVSHEDNLRSLFSACLELLA